MSSRHSNRTQDEQSYSKPQTNFEIESVDGELEDSVDYVINELGFLILTSILK